MEVSIIWKFNLLTQTWYTLSYTAHVYQASCGAATGESSPEFAAWWENFDLMTFSIKDPDALVEEVSRLQLVTPEEKNFIVKCCVGKVKNKCRALLQITEGKIKSQPRCFHQFLIALKNLPNLSHLAAILQSSYGKCNDNAIICFILSSRLQIIG